MAENVRFPRRALLGAVATLCAILPLTVCGVDARNSSQKSSESGFHHPPPGATPHPFSTIGTMNSFQCGSGSAIFSNISNQLNILTTVPTDGSCGIAGVQWVGLKNTQLTQISFDVFGAGCTNDEVFGVFMFLTEPSSTVPLACEDFVQIPLNNGFTRYIVRPSSPTKVSGITIAHIGSLGSNANHVIGNFLFNGNQSPFIQLNNLHPCPSQFNCNSSSSQ